MAMHGPKQGTTANSKAWRYAYIKEYKSRGGDMSTYKLWLCMVPNKALQQTVRLGGMHTLKNINLGEGICPLTNYGCTWSQIQTRQCSKQQELPREVCICYRLQSCMYTTISIQWDVLLHIHALYYGTSWKWMRLSIPSRNDGVEFGPQCEIERLYPSGYRW